MDAWVVGLVAVCMVGVAAILAGALLDRRANRRRATAMLAPPPRDIPHFVPNQGTPQYLSELMARRPPVESAPALTPADRAALTAAIALPGSVCIGVGFASPDFVTDTEAGWAVLAAPRVLVVAEPPGSLRELIPVLEKAALSGTPLVVAAPSLPPEVLATLAVNQIQRRAELLAVTSPDPAVLDAVVAATGARLVSRIDLQASYLSDADLGRCDRWVSGRDTSWVLPSTRDCLTPR